MIVVSTHTNPAQKWRSEGSEFFVQELSFNSDGPVNFRIEHLDGSPALVDAGELRLVEGTIPDGWVLGQRPGSQSFVLGPAEWQEPSFWERWMDREPDARASYDRLRSGPLNVEAHDFETIYPSIEHCFSANTSDVESLLPIDGEISFDLTLLVSSGSGESEEFGVRVASASSTRANAGAEHGVMLVDPETYSFSKVRLSLERTVQGCARSTWEETLRALSDQLVRNPPN